MNAAVLEREVPQEVTVVATYAAGQYGLRRIAAPALPLAGPFVSQERVIGRAWVRPSNGAVVATDIGRPRHLTEPELRRALGEAILQVRRRLRGPQLNSAIAYLMRQYQSEQIPDAQAAMAAADLGPGSTDAVVPQAEEQRRQEVKRLRRRNAAGSLVRHSPRSRWARGLALALSL